MCFLVSARPCRWGGLPIQFLHRNLAAHEQLATSEPFLMLRRACMRSCVGNGSAREMGGGAQPARRAGL
eukprot:3987817-Pleurochrysis_carterae.AAC.2